uniref:C2H2-type domain-containing protein n=1 Tax=Eptatretus burgeri TaxID=7764 RepID=A0A8C4Q9X9_EPTBU
GVSPGAEGAPAVSHAGGFVIYLFGIGAASFECTSTCFIFLLSIPHFLFTGKTFNCCADGCSEMFNNMQLLLNHMRVHHKPNRFFKCERCSIRFCTYRSLLKHLHVCLNLDTPATVILFSLGNVIHFFPFQPLPRHLPVDPLALHGYALKGRRAAQMALGSLPGVHGNRRVAWTHTRGRYTCVQCPFSSLSRQDATLHAYTHRSSFFLPLTIPFPLPNHPATPLQLAWVPIWSLRLKKRTRFPQ